MLSSQLKESQSELETLIKIFAKMPGLGPRSAQRLVFHLIKKREIMNHLKDSNKDFKKFYASNKYFSISKISDGLLCLYFFAPPSLLAK